MEARVRALVREVKANPALLRELGRELFPQVFVVTAGEYSDYRIYGAFLDRAAAQAYCDRENVVGDEREPRNCDRRNVEEWGTVGPEGEEAPGAFYVLMDVEGNSIHGARWDPLKWASEPAETLRTPNNERDRVRFRGYGATEEHAKRSANEARRKWLAEHP